MTLFWPTGSDFKKDYRYFDEDVCGEVQGVLIYSDEDVCGEVQGVLIYFDEDVCGEVQVS